MKKLLGLLAVAPMALAACGAAEETTPEVAFEGTLSSGVYKVEAEGHKSTIELMVKVSADKIDSIKLVSEDDSDSQWATAWTAMENEFDGLTAEELNDYVATPSDISGATNSSNGIVEAVKSVIDNDANLINFMKFTYGDITAELGYMIGDSYEIPHYMDGETATACPIVGSTFDAISIPSDDTTSMRRIFTGTENKMFINMGMGWGNTDAGMTMLTYDMLFENTSDFKLAYFGDTPEADQAACPGA